MTHTSLKPDEITPELLRYFAIMFNKYSTRQFYLRDKEKEKQQGE